MVAPPRLLLVVACLAGAGCYSVGFEPEGGMTAIAVPLFANQTLRRGVEHELTRQVRREVLETTPLHLAHLGGAGQRVLRGAITSIDENLLLAGPAEEVLESSVSVNVRFGVYVGPRLVIGEDVDGDGDPDGELLLTGFAEFDTERGESRETATREAIEDLAEMIVFRLAAREDDRHEPNDAAADAVRLRTGRQMALIQRDVDWFSVEVARGQSLEVALFGAGPGIRLDVLDAAGGAVPDAQRLDGGQTVRVPEGDAARVFLLRVTGEDEGERYRLSVRARGLRAE